MIPRIALALSALLVGQSLHAAENALAEAQEALASSNRRRGNSSLELLLQDNRLILIRKVQIRPDLRIDYVQSVQCRDLDPTLISLEQSPTTLPCVRLPARGGRKLVQKKALFYYAHKVEEAPEIKNEEQAVQMVVECHPYDQKALAEALRLLLSPSP
jgi:hypothetical protein